MTIHDYIDFFEFCIAVLGVVVPLCICIKEHYSKQRKELAEQVIAYWCLQEEAVKWISELSPDEKKVKLTLRQRAQHNKDNVHRTYPKMALREAADYL